MKKEKQVQVNEEYAWIVTRKRNGQIVTPAGISFETEYKKCPIDAIVNPIYKDEYENIRVCIMNSKNKE